MWNICGVHLKNGEKKQVMIEPGVEGYEIPTTLICGKHPGKTLLVTAGIHAGEYPGIAAVKQFAEVIDPSVVQGNIILMHCVNTSGFWKRTVAILPEDGFNFNHDYPGREYGTVGERIAWYFMQEIFPKVDFILDLHSGSDTEVMIPLAFYTNAEEVKETAYRAARALDLPYLVESTATKGQYSYAAHHYKVPGLLLEIGHSHSCEKEWVELYDRNIKLLLEHLEMASFGEEKKTKRQKVFKDAIYLSSFEQGLWYPSVKLEQRFKKGEMLGKTEDFFGNPISTYFAEADGTVLYYTNGLSVPDNSFLIAYGLEKNSEIIEG